MKNRKVLHEKIITDVARSTEVDLSIAKKIIKEYYNFMKEELNSGAEIITPIGRLMISERRLNTTTFCNKNSTHKITYKIDNEYKKFLDSRSE